MMTKTKTHFGRALRTARQNAGKTLGDVGDKISVSAAYLSDVERGNRQPLSADRIAEVATFLAASVEDLMQAAARDRKELRVSTDGMSAERVEIGAMMLRGLHDLDDEALKSLADQIRMKLQGKGE